MVEFEVWKTEQGITDSLHYHYSIRQKGHQMPVIIHLDEFKTLFPNIDPEKVPSAPQVTYIKIEAKLLPKKG
jgi:hypothetical protein